MCGPEMVTDFKLDGATVQGLLKAINAYLKKVKCEPEEYGFNVASTYAYPYGRDETPLPGSKDCRWLIAYVVEGGSEGYYVHLGAILSRRSIEMNHKAEEWGGTLKTVYTPHPESTVYVEFGLAKTYSAESAYGICREAQRFLTAARWN